MKFKYEVVSDNNEVSLIGIEGECPEILKIPTFIDVDNKKMKVVRIMFHSIYYRLKYRGENGITCKVLYIPETVEIFNLTHNKYIQEVYLPNSLTKICNSAFSNCEELKTVHLPQNLEQIGHGAFSHCKKLENISIPLTVVKMGNACFCDCALKEITLPNSLAEIPQEAFKNCKELSKVDIPSSIKTIYNSAFENCNSIKQVIIPKGYQNNLSKIFQHSDTIEFIYRVQELNIRGYKKTGAYTYGHFRPCPYCGSDDVTTFCDGTAECNACGGEYTYQY